MISRPAPARPNAASIGFSLAGVIVFLFAARYWIHDALPYANYAEDAYRRFWPVRTGLLLHIAGGTVALLAGPFQLWLGIRGALRRLHRWIGYAYIAGCTLSACSSFYLAMHSKPDFGLSLAILAVVWLATIAMAFTAVWNRRFDAHREWMARSYIVTLSFATYRFLKPLSVFAGLGNSRQAMVLWISWVVPMMCFELVTQWHRVMPLKRRAAPVPTREIT